MSFEVLRRKPSSQQLDVHKGLRGFLKSEAADATFLVSAAGRKFPQLNVFSCHFSWFEWKPLFKGLSRVYCGHGQHCDG